jgi:hypothetical protein
LIAHGKATAQLLAGGNGGIGIEAEDGRQVAGGLAGDGRGRWIDHRGGGWGIEGFGGVAIGLELGLIVEVLAEGGGEEDGS